MKVMSLLPMMMIASLVLLASSQSEAQAAANCDGANWCYPDMGTCTQHCSDNCQLANGCYVAPVCSKTAACKDNNLPVKCSCS